MPSARFKPAIPVIQWLQTYALNRTSSWFGEHLTTLPLFETHAFIRDDIFCQWVTCWCTERRHLVFAAQKISHIYLFSYLDSLLPFLRPALWLQWKTSASAWLPSFVTQRATVSQNVWAATVARGKPQPFPDNLSFLKTCNITSFVYLSTSVYWAQNCMTRPALHSPLPPTQKCLTVRSLGFTRL